jgi:hypothetical protein
LFNQSQNRMKLEATRPGLVADAQSAIDTNTYRNAQLGQAAAKLGETQREFGITTAQKAAATKGALDYKYNALATTTDYKNRALASTNAYHQGLLDASTGRTALGYAKVAQSAADKKADRAATKAYHDSYLAHLTAGDSERVAHDKALEAATTERNAISQENANTSAFNANTSRINAKTSAVRASNANVPKYSSSVSRSLGFRADQYGNPIGGKYTALPGFKATKTPGIYAKASSGKTGGVSATSYANLRKQALAKADLFYYGKQPTTAGGTNGIPGIDYGAALKQLMNGYSLSKADAIAILNDFYAPGERGRPQTAASQRARIMNPSSVASGLLTPPAK